MKVIFLYTSHGAATPNSISDNWKPPKKCGSQYDKSDGDGIFKLFEELYRNNVITDLRVFYESNRAPGRANWIPGVYCCVVPEIRFVERYIKEKTIIFVRGGFRHWHDILVKYKNKNWLILYAANTGRERWKWWDVILEDRQRLNVVDPHERYWNFYIKPINEEVFFPSKQEIKYDLCIGASHIHDKKGQWRTIEVLIKHKEKFGRCLRTIMPGAARKGVRSSQMHDKIKRHGLDVTIPGELSKGELRRTFNESKCFIHLGTHGQNDRGPLEALACGTPLIIGSPYYHSPIVNEIAHVPTNINDFNEVAVKLEGWLKKYNRLTKDTVYQYYKRNHSFDISYVRMKSLLQIMDQFEPGLNAKIALKEVFDY